MNSLPSLSTLTSVASPSISSPSISIVVPVYNGGNAFRRCLSSLTRWLPKLDGQGDSQQDDSQGDSRSAEAAPIEIIVVSDGDSDGSWRLAEEFGVRLIRCSESKGPAKARNIGAQAATGDILFFIDADVEILPETIARVQESFRSHPQLAALIGSYDDAPGAPNFLSQYKNLFHHYTHQTACLEASTFWGACGAIRRPIFQAVGGFDESYRRPCIEDIELGYRLKQADYTIHLRKDIQVKHLKKWTPLSLLRADVFYRALPWMSLLWKVRQSHPAQYQQFTSDLNLKWNSRISVMLVYVLLMCVAITPWMNAALVLALLPGGVLLLINLPVYQFFHQKRGWLFALKTVPWHWLYFFYSGLAYVFTLVRHYLRPYLGGRRLLGSLGR
jgi:glycosyltransferase involved in cell wall biosynthesis